MEPEEVAAALRRIARGFDDLADAMSGQAATEEPRVAAILQEWGERGLTRQEASALFRKHGFAPQTAGGWVRGEWIESRDGLRYVAERSRRWLDDRDVTGG
ncbi:hypothetical protein BH20ACT2_BH20ACT2_14020 [soil metagenome]